MARVWASSTAGLLAELIGHQDSVLTATARVCDAGHRRLLAPLQRHLQPGASAAFRHDSGRLVTASWDGTARIWETATGRLLAVLSGHHARLRSAMFSPDGRRIITASDDASARIWDVSPDLPASNELRKFMACVLPVRLEPVRKSVVLPNEPAPEHCQGVGLPP